MSKWQYTKGLHDLGRSCFAYLQPDGSWGWSNAGLIVDGDQTLLVDTLFDLPLTAEMLTTMRDAVPAARRIQKLINTHANGDHTFGNQLVKARKSSPAGPVPKNTPRRRRQRSPHALRRGNSPATAAPFSRKSWAAASIGAA